MELVNGAGASAGIVMKGSLLFGGVKIVSWLGNCTGWPYLHRSRVWVPMGQGTGSYANTLNL